MKISLLTAVFAVFFVFSSSPSNASTVVETVQIRTFDGVLLSGIWTIPQSVVGSALILQGSGNVGADGDVSGPFLGSGYQNKKPNLSEQLAEELAQAGIATLRFSKRGVEDANELPHQTMDYLAKDAFYAFKMVQTRFLGVKNAIVGLSEGALLAVMVSNQTPVDSLYLLSIPTRPIDETLSYQFLGWPTELLMSKLDARHTGTISGVSMNSASNFVLPQIGAKWDAADLNQDGSLSVTEELIPVYQEFYKNARGLLSTPALSYWYQSMLALPQFSKMASAIQAKKIFIYQGLEDAQVKWNWVVEDALYFSVKPAMHFYPQLGHCFSPMVGSFNEVKTSGPYSKDLIEQLKKDF